MNTLSSLLQWIGNVIGANPNTLTTTNKTIVGAINEVNALTVDTVDLDEISVTTANVNASISIPATKSGYVPIGVVGYAITNATSASSGYGSAALLRIRVSGNDIVASVRNHGSSTIKIRLYAYVLYKKQ